jgi:hypothetical protein
MFRVILVVVVIFALLMVGRLIRGVPRKPRQR